MAKIDIGIREKDREAIAHGLSRLLADTNTLLGVESLLPVGKVKRYTRGEPISSGRVRGLHILRSGHAKMSVASADGREAMLALLGPDDVFSELELNGKDGHAVSVTALEACETRHVTSLELARRLREHPSLALLLAGRLVARVRGAYSRIASLALLDVEARVAQALLDVAVLRDGVWTAAVGSEEMARRVAASREMVSRVAKTMCGHRLIRRQRGRTIILDREGLARIVTGPRHEVRPPQALLAEA